MSEINDLEDVIKTASQAVNNANLTDKDQKLEAFKYALNHLWAVRHGNAKKAKKK